MRKHLCRKRSLGSHDSRAFTLVEIVVVVVVIGLLAALAIPAIQRSRNTAVEKTMIHDARQISSSLNQYFTENGEPSVSLATLVGGNSAYMRALSSGVIVYQGKRTARIAAPAQASFATVNFVRPNDTLTPEAKIFAICHPGYSTAISSTQKVINGYDTDTNVLNFAGDTGELLSKDGRRWGAGALYAAPVDGADTP